LVAPLLQDSIKLVRITAARTLAPVAAPSLPEALRPALVAATRELAEGHALNADDPAALVELGDDRAERARTLEAEAWYRRALELEPGFVPAYLNLADLLRATGREPDAETVLVEGRARAPSSAMVAYALGLSHVRQNRLVEALEELETATRLDPSDPRPLVALVLALDRVGRSAEAVERAQELVRRHPDDPAYRSLLEDLRTRGGSP
jgi:Flp pilus assembly protein TadD